MHPRFVPLKGAPEQLSDAWFAQRRGRLTGSKYSNLYFIGSEEEYHEYYGIVWENKPRPPFSEEAKAYMAYGRKHEDIALVDFLNKAPPRVGDIYVAESPFYAHTTSFLGASPDGTYAIYDGEKLVEEGIIEIKCPGKTKRPYTKFKYYYVAQTYAEMSCSGLRNAITISWGPKNMRAWRWRWDQKVWNVVCNMIEGFRNHVPYSEFVELQDQLLKVSKQVVDTAECLHEGNGFSI